MPRLTPFHVAIRVHDIAAARAFYGGLPGCAEGRSAERRVDFDLYGHPLVVHRASRAAMRSTATTCRFRTSAWCRNRPTGTPSPAGRLRAGGADFVIEPHVRFAGRPGEQATLFLLGPSGNALEFKAFADIEGQLFARQPAPAPAPAWRRGGRVKPPRAAPAPVLLDTVRATRRGFMPDPRRALSARRCAPAHG